MDGVTQRTMDGTDGTSLCTSSTDGIRTGFTRYKILLLIFIVTTLNYVDRATLSVAAPMMRTEFGFDALTMGIAFSAFGWAYTGLQIPGGWILDRFGAKKVYGIGLLAWSLCTFSQGHISLFANAFMALFVMRFAMGIAEAPAFPANSRLTVMWFPIQERGFATSVFSCAQYFALALFTPFMTWGVHEFGWRSIFYAAGGVGIAIGLFWLYYINTPERHKGVSPAELSYIQGSAESKASNEESANSISFSKAWKTLSNRMMIGIYIGQYSLTTMSWFFLTWFPTYLMEAKGLSIMKAGIFTAIPGIAAFVGGLLGGLLSDWLLKRGYSLSIARKTPIIVGLLFSSVIVIGNYVDSQWLVLTVMTIAFFAKGLGTQGWTIVGDVAPKGTIGLTGGVFNFCGNIASIVTPIAIGAILKATNSFNYALIYVSIISLIGAFSYIFVVGELRRLEIGETA